MKKIKVSIKPYEHECSDGCCYEQGESIYVDDEHLGDIPTQSPENMLQLILTHLGYDLEIVGMDKDGAEIWSM